MQSFIVQVRLFVTIASAAVLLVGCSDDPRLYTIHGEVTYLGEPIRKGQILFADSTGNGPTAHGLIADGKYSIETVEGNKVVRITATKETGNMIEGAMGATYPEVVDLIPAQYNSASTLRTTVGAEESLVVDFLLR